MRLASARKRKKNFLDFDASRRDIGWLSMVSKLTLISRMDKKPPLLIITIS